MSSPPPAYELFDRPAAPPQIFDRIQSVVEAECETFSEDTTEKLRLSNFILYCLAVDYSTFNFMKLSDEDHEHYLKLADILASMRRAPEYNQRNDLAILGPYIWKHLREPCISLSIPIECAILVVLRFAKFQSCSKRYKGCVRGLSHNHRLHVMARKLWIDRQLLIHRLVMSEQKRTKLNHALLSTARRLFILIDGTGSTISALVGVDTDPAEEGNFKYILTSPGQWFDEHTNHSLPPVQRAIRPLLENAALGVARILRGKHQSRHPVFPEGS
ncbi:hypothetical protein E2P81_ATG10332 [Venturia nashicola]|nr:hypothetical protein E2P81_ATG10332 [Venturia nashicola]